MSRRANRVFISYRRDDAAGYAGRLEEALERRLGHGSARALMHAQQRSSG